MNRYYSKIGGRFQSADRDDFHLPHPQTLNRYVYALLVTECGTPLPLSPNVVANSSLAWNTGAGLLSAMMSSGWGMEAASQLVLLTAQYQDYMLASGQRNIGAYGSFTPPQTGALMAAMDSVFDALHNENCSNMFLDWSGADGLVNLQRVTISSLTSATRPAGISDSDWAALLDARADPTTGGFAFVNTPFVYLSDRALTLDTSRVATLIIHEMLHSAGAPGGARPGSIDDYEKNYAEISANCGTDNPLH